MERTVVTVSDVTFSYNGVDLSLKDLNLGLLGLFGVTLWWWLWTMRDARDSTRTADLLVLIGLIAWHWYLRHHHYLLLKTLACMAVLKLCHNYVKNTSDPPPKGEAPLIIPSWTSHTRFFPQKHSFGYSILQVALPVGSEGRFGQLLSVGNVQKKGWYHVQASDYLHRTSDDQTLYGKLKAYLQSHDVEDSEWDHAYLITAPRFMGYSFNPVSFWYIYTADNVLTMMILEVNNTFGERRMYLLHAKDSGEQNEDSDVNNLTTSTDDSFHHPPCLSKSDGKFRNSWAKDFHVSPFSSRKGCYMLTANDPFHREKEGESIDLNNTITLKSSKDHVKLVARIVSVGHSINPLTSTWYETIRFVMSWFLVGFLTFPRILKEAAVLFWAKGLHVWYRPEVLPSSIGREEEPIEAGLAPFFETYLKHIVAQHTKPINVIYTSNIRGKSPCTYSNVHVDEQSQASSSKLELRVLSPAFFARFMHYAHSTEAFDRECVFTDEKNRTIWVSRPELLYDLLKQDPCSSRARTESLNPVQRFKWNIHVMLRCAPADPAYPFSGAATQKREDIRKKTLSPLDHYVLTYMRADASSYRRLCARLFLAQRVAFGFVQVVDLVDVAVRAMLIWKGVSNLSWTAGWITSYAWLMSVHLWAFMK
ncbi:uncharacterized protein PV09_06125 [Verruconis gallopava]|uniref:DUF1365 domain-containing protein n=1 Tax=Verruconis gallopava TaxID=253628 RepID=A0A0D2A7F9_9PEZI|nr:uncharacterized protein PV09_06125 [Verruconis gallopava]KIW02688.1 hypothetical protein PV09_06125 [Verruconis gallopava]